MRQHAVADDDIEAPLGRAEQPFAAIRCVVDGVAAFLQSFDEKARRLGIVLDE